MMVRKIFFIRPPSHSASPARTFGVASRNVFPKVQLSVEFPRPSYADSFPKPTRNLSAASARALQDRHLPKTAADDLAPAKCNPERGSRWCADRSASAILRDRRTRGFL